MLNILIVDDEIQIVEHLHKIISAKYKDELNILHTSLSREAKEIVQTQIVDILLSDIKMPKIDGFEVAEAAKEINPNCKVIFLTGWNEFDYVYNAIKSHCDDFILKTDTDSEILSSVGKVIDKVKREIKSKEFMTKAQKYEKFFEPDTVNNDDPISYLKNYIWQNINTEISLKRLAGLVYLNPSYLSRVFKQETNTTLTEYVLQVRIMRAKEYLVDTQMKIQEIAEAVGIDSATYFGRIFKNETGLTPQDYRKKNMKS